METIRKREAWNKGKLVGQRPPLKPKEILAVRIHLRNRHAVRALATLNLAIDGELRGCDLVSGRLRDISHRNQILPRAMVIQRKTQRPVQFELTEQTRSAVTALRISVNVTGRFGGGDRVMWVALCGVSATKTTWRGPTSYQGQ